ncbi:hypothetical protein HDV05_004537 [Chytridiales sp. JEL 0842]|nr:hypothetical protein HDV05_004537 [Chytridiales sp. JEL 0842]
METIPCTRFVETITATLSNSTLCPAIEDAQAMETRQRFLADASALCREETFAGDLKSGNVFAIKNDPIEGIECGFGLNPATPVLSLQSAYTYCTETVRPDQCCQDDDILLEYIDAGVFPEQTTVDPSTNPSNNPSRGTTPTKGLNRPRKPLATCEIVFNRFFIVPCSSVIGLSVGVILIVIAGVFSYRIISRQDKTAMAQTKSGQFQKDTQWVRSWFRNSPLGNTAYKSTFDRDEHKAAKKRQTQLSEGFYAEETANNTMFNEQNNRMGSASMDYTGSVASTDPLHRPISPPPNTYHYQQQQQQQPHQRINTSTDPYNLMMGATNGLPSPPPKGMSGGRPGYGVPPPPQPQSPQGNGGGYTTTYQPHNQGGGQFRGY